MKGRFISKERIRKESRKTPERGVFEIEKEKAAARWKKKEREKARYGRESLLRAEQGKKEATKALLEIINGESCDLEKLGKAINDGGDLDASIDGRSLLTIAAEGGHSKAVKMLLDAGVEADGLVPYCWGQTALVKASAKGKTEAVRVLLEAGADVNSHNRDGYTALIEAAMNGHAETAQVLLDAGAEINAMLFNGKTALDLAEKQEIKELLEGAGAKHGKDL